MNAERRVYSLSELAKSLRSVIDRNYSSSYWIKAEIAKLNHYPRSGHCYPDLVDKSGDQILAQMRGIIWAADFRNANTEFIKVTGQALSEGMSVLLQATVTFHPVHGLSLLIHYIEPAFTLGQMAHEKMKSLERLKKEGIFDKNRSLSMPLLPRKLAIISVETSKGYHDFLQIINIYSKRFGIWHYLFPALLQGDRAVEAIISQLRRIRKLADMFDMVAIIRGGGGDVGLNAFDSFFLAREIALFPIPVITGIGHATNQTIAEMVAWENKITPTDVAYFVAAHFTEFENRLQKSKEVIFSKTEKIIKQKNQHLQDRASSLSSFSLKTISREKQQLLFIKTKAEAASIRYIVQHKRYLENMQEKINLLDPRQVLKRGYSITSFNNRSIRSIDEIVQGDVINTRLFQGEIISTVQNKKTDHGK